MLSQVETKKIHRSISQVESNIERLFAVTISPKAGGFLKKIKERAADDYYPIRDAIDALQEEPRPKDAVILPNQPDSCRLKVAGYYIHYNVDDKRQRIVIVEIFKSGNQEVSNGS